MSSIMSTGVDASKEMITVARNDNPGPNISYHVCDARACGDNPDWRERFDKVVSFYVLHWFPDQPKAFDSILACLVDPPRAAAERET